MDSKPSQNSNDDFLTWVGVADVLVVPIPVREAMKAAGYDPPKLVPMSLLMLTLMLTRMTETLRVEDGEVVRVERKTGEDPKQIACVLCSIYELSRFGGSLAYIFSTRTHTFTLLGGEFLEQSRREDAGASKSVQPSTTSAIR